MLGNEIIKDRKFQYAKEPSRDVSNRLVQVTPLLKEAIAGCARLGGCAMIDDRYVIVDTKKYEVILRK